MRSVKEIDVSSQQGGQWKKQMFHYNRAVSETNIRFIISGQSVKQIYVSLYQGSQWKK